MCLYPRLIKNRKYIANKKNEGVIPSFPIHKGKEDKRVMYAPVGCGKCIECRRKKARDWSVRLSEEIRHDNNAKFVTLTFNTEKIIELSEGIRAEGYERDLTIVKKAVRRFLESWRAETKKSVKHWFISEIGGGRYEHIHIHGLIWGREEMIKKHWEKNGFVFIGDYVSEKTVNYIVKYMHKIDEKHKEFNPRILTSAGIGKGYLERSDSKNNRYNGERTKEYYRQRNGSKLALPIYYRNHIYSEDEKERLWLKKLDEEKRYIMGEEVDISKGEENYYKLLKYYQRENTELGYGTNEIDWERKHYENDRRNTLYMERIKKTERNDK